MLRDRKSHAWELRRPNPKAVCERFSDDYEKQLEFIVHTLEKRGFVVDIAGAGGRMVNISMRPTKTALACSYTLKIQKRHDSSL